MKPISSFTYRDPEVQAVISLSGVLILSLGGVLLQAAGVMDVHERFPWMAAGAFMLFFAMFNALLSLTAEDMNKYWGRSTFCYVLLVLISGGLAYLFSGLSINEAGTFKWIFFVVSFGYFIFLSLIRLVKKIVEYAQKEEWNHPRIRKNKRR